jgi:hypothetical protein
MVPNQLIDIGPLVFGGVFAVLALVSLIALIPVILIVANRAEPDARGMRPFTVYLFGMTFFTLNLAYAGLTMIVTALLSFISPHDLPLTNGVAKEVVIGALFLLIAGSIMHFHLRQGLAAARGDGRVDGVNARVLHSYIGVISFVYVFTAMLSLGIVIYLIFQLAGPGVFGGGASRTATLTTLLDFVYVLVASAGIVMYHWRMAPPGMLRIPSMPQMPSTPAPRAAPPVQ